MACVCVSPKFENQGIGVRLMTFIENFARQNGVKSLFCLSNPSHQLLPAKRRLPGRRPRRPPADAPATVRSERAEVEGADQDAVKKPRRIAHRSPLNRRKSLSNETISKPPQIAKRGEKRNRSRVLA